MSLALGWGLAFSTVVTLFLVPCLYTLAQDLRGLRLADLRLRPVSTTRPAAAGVSLRRVAGDSSATESSSTSPTPG
jgi:hypothetical protein